MRIVLTLFLCLFALLQAQTSYFSDAMLNDPIGNKDHWDKLLLKSEVPEFKQNQLVNSILLPNDYVSYKLNNTSVQGALTRDPYFFTLEGRQTSSGASLSLWAK